MTATSSVRMTAAVKADTLDYFLPSILSQETKRRLEVGEELISYLRNKQTSLYCEEMDKLADGLASWVSSSSFKVFFYTLLISALYSLY